jgi:hypothetical protein
MWMRYKVPQIQQPIKPQDLRRGTHSSAIARADSLTRARYSRTGMSRVGALARFEPREPRLPALIPSAQLREVLAYAKTCKLRPLYEVRLIRKYRLINPGLFLLTGPLL